MCERNPHSALFNTKTNEIIRPGCNTYGCPECGPKKARKLGEHLKKYLEDWDHIRFWTFTMSNKYHEDENEHYRDLMNIWSKFITYLRRSKSLRKKQQKFQFIRVIERHKSGYMHLHVFISEYLPYEVVNPIWESLCKEYCKTEEHCGQSFVKGLKNAGFVSFYVTKYVTKAVVQLTERVRRWGTSHGIKIFPVKKTSGLWIYLDVRLGVCEALEKSGLIHPSLFILCNHNSTNEKMHSVSSSVEEMFNEQLFDYTACKIVHPETAYTEHIDLQDMMHK